MTMADLYRAVKRLPKEALKHDGFRSDRLGEGMYRELSPGVNVVFHVNGAWSHVELYGGLRFSEVNRLLGRASTEAGWPKQKASAFTLELLGLLRYKIGDFCGSAEDIDVYCPVGSKIADLLQLENLIRETARSLENLTDLRECTLHAYGLRPHGPYDKYMIPAAASLLRDERLLAESADFFLQGLQTEEIPAYQRLIGVLTKEARSPS